MKASKWLVAGFWISTVLFALQMGFTAYAQLRLPQVAAAFAHLGFPAWFRIELSWAKFAGLAALLIPAVPARVKEWAYAWGDSETIAAPSFTALPGRDSHSYKSKRSSGKQSLWRWATR